MSFAEDFLIYLTSYHKGYKLMRARMSGYGGPPEVLFGEPRKERRIKITTFRVTVSRLEKQGYIERDGLLWHITDKGRTYMKERVAKQLPSHCRWNTEKAARTKNMIIVFDIPEKLRGKRAWLREELSRLGFIMLQKSVWLGPSLLPKEFIQHVQNLNLLRYLKFFRANEAEII